MGCGSGSVPKKARRTECNPEREEEEEICKVFTVEMGTLECDICFLPFQSEIYSNGHAACANCCINMERKCPSCNESMGDFRCRAMEKVLAGMTRPCRFKKHGCRETVRYTEARNHEEDLCCYAPYRCPFEGCACRGRLLYGHIMDTHSHGSSLAKLQKCEPFCVLLNRDKKSVFLVLNGGDVPTGRSLSLIRVCPYPQEGEGIGVDVKYKLVVHGGDRTSIRLEASMPVPFVRRLDGYKAKLFLFVPDAFWGSSGSVIVTMLD
uniref:Uncharacterized protein n=1 Tax=Avena sativa TaxID=4498 RepID=A0ACD5VJI1_AVESA